MALDDFLLDLLEDPLDHGPLLYVPSKSVLFNPRRHVVYEVRDSIPRHAYRLRNSPEIPGFFRPEGAPRGALVVARPGE